MYKATAAFLLYANARKACRESELKQTVGVLALNADVAGATTCMRARLRFLSFNRMLGASVS